MIDVNIIFIRVFFLIPTKHIRNYLVFYQDCEALWCLIIISFFIYSKYLYTNKF